MSPERAARPFSHLVFAGFAPGDMGASAWDRVAAVSRERTLLPGDSPELAAALRSADGLLLAPGLGAGRERIDAAPGLRYIGMFGTGVGRIDVEHARSRGILVRNVEDYSTEGVAEFVAAVVLARLRDLHLARDEARAGRLSEAPFTGSEIAGRTWGVVGLGRIGRRVAGMARAGFGAEVVYWSRASRADGPGMTYAELPDLLSRAEIVSIHLAHAPATEGLLGDAAFAAMRPDAVVVNASPMDLVSLPALERALATESFTFILDHPEGLLPEALARLAARPNCVVYPSIGYRTAEAARAKEELFVRALEEAAAEAGDGRAGRPTA